MLGSFALTAALWVVSDPSGASVYVNGRLTGQTPLTIQLAAGDHRVRLVKDGYLDNSRTVTVRQQGSTKLHVALTRDMTAAAVSAQASSGGSKTWVWLAAAGGAAAAAGIYVAHRNHAPAAGSITVAPAAVGMAAITTFLFDSTATDKDGDALVYSWNFGDGGTSTSKTPTHVYQSTGAFNVTLRVSDGKTAPVAAAGALVTVAPSLTGTWTGANAIPFFPCGITFTATQNGSTLSGFLRLTAGTVGCSATPPIAIASASVDPLSYPTTVTWTSEPFSFAFLPSPVVIANLTIRFTGTTNAGGTSVTGTFQTIRAGVVAATSGLTFTK